MVMGASRNMHIDKQVGITLDIIGLLLLTLSALVKLPIFWPVFGMGCILVGTYKLVARLFSEYSHNKNLPENGS